MKWPIRCVLSGCALALLSVLPGCGPTGYKNDQSGTAEVQQRVQQGQPLYQPPAGAPVPGAPGYNPGGPPTGMPGGPPGPSPGQPANP